MCPRQSQTGVYWKRRVRNFFIGGRGTGAVFLPPKGFFAMEDSEIFQLLGQFGIDAALVAAAVAVIVRVLRQTLFKDKANALLTAVLPFALGAVLFAAVQCVTHPSWEYLSENIADILRRGFATGCLATLFGAFLSRFTGKKALSAKESVVRELLSGVASGQNLDDLAVKVAACVSEEYSAEDIERVEETLRAYAEECAAENAADDLRVLAELIVRTLETTAV